ncbi:MULTISPECIES: hypothetical protein [unclassified Amycolatopsis]|uniref:hypothetical protein n=1 Tax=unclassified Amycolatopsis TaxID=2618356 RepID=UPI001FF6CAC7|nr:MULTISPECIES: hypothetical protein [unclassified Amycolatopsis]UOZ09701.1 hypothetical protein MUY22_16075 [Amycolatopsis sp. WQ 127309]WSJ75999.1 hypothetical protein OG439_42455 [Amycolatopsis sp. NBC_01307]WSK80396.1 hypothetical protein OG570_07440 [Amycolatopsis sp. NBC_01286]
MPDGYTASSEAMTRAQIRLNDVADDPAGEAKKVAPTAIVAADFGRVHQEGFGKYKAGIDEIGAGMTGLSNALMNLGSGIGTAGGKYTTQESDAGAQANAAGSK